MLTNAQEHLDQLECIRKSWAALPASFLQSYQEGSVLKSLHETPQAVVDEAVVPEVSAPIRHRPEPEIARGRGQPIVEPMAKKVCLGVSRKKKTV